MDLPRHLVLWAFVCLGSVLLACGVWGVEQEEQLSMETPEPSPEEIRALEDLYEAAGGPHWRQNQQWKTGEGRPCASLWEGVECNAEGHVVALRLERQELEGTIPESIGDLLYLENLLLMKNSLRGSLPVSIGRLHKLEILAVFSNLLSGPLPESLGECTELKGLILFNNSLSGPLPRSLAKLHKLQFIDLRKNDLEGVLPPEWSESEQLEGIWLQNNPRLSGPLPSEWSQLTELKELQVWNTGVSGAIPESWGELSMLRELILFNNSLSGTLPVSLGKLVSLKWLYLGGNDLDGTIPPELGNMEALRGLSLSRNRFTGPLPDALGHLQKLDIFDLSQNPLGGEFPSMIGQLSNLKELGLAECLLEGPIPAHVVEGLTTLHVVTLKGNRLQGSLPVELALSPHLHTMDVSENEFVGSLPFPVDHLRELRFTGNPHADEVVRSVSNPNMNTTSRFLGRGDQHSAVAPFRFHLDAKDYFTFPARLRVSCPLGHAIAIECMEREDIRVASGLPLPQIWDILSAPPSTMPLSRDTFDSEQWHLHATPRGTWSGRNSRCTVHIEDETRDEL